MQNTRFPSLWWLGLVLLGASASAGALGFGASSPAAVLGQPLDFGVALRLEPGESLDPGCLRAAVKVGEVDWPRDAVSAQLESTGLNAPTQVRVRSTAPIDEPVVEIQISAGCPARMTRRFVVFADPPVRPVGMQLVAAIEPAVLASEPRPDAPSAASVTPDLLPTPAPAAVRRTPRPAKVAVRASAPSERRLAQAAAPPRQAAGNTAPRSRPRLQLDAAPPSPVRNSPTAVLSAEALAAVDEANEVVKAAIAAASASQGRMAALEASVQQLRAEAAAQRALVQQLREQAADADSRTRWLVPMLLAALALATLSLWLWLRLREIERERQQSWLDAARRVPADGAAPMPAAPALPVLMERRLRGDRAAGAGLAPVHRPPPSELPAAPAPDDAAADEWPYKTMPVTVPVEEGRDVSAEELIDLEQQAEFFIVLGQEQAAVDLLSTHLRDSGGSSPLPYLRLLDLYHRLGDRIAYERTREQFNERFDAQVPAWDDHAQGGRTLEAYPSAIRRLQSAWAQPADAMLVLEALMLGRDGDEVFDLAAYRELLLLYALARELADAAGSAAPVDLLLPLEAPLSFGGTTPRPYFAPEDSGSGEARPSARVDLDLTAPDDRSSRFSVF